MFMIRKRLVKRVASCLMAFAMTVTGFPVGTFIGKAETEESGVKYVVAGGSTPVAWGAEAEENVMKKSKYDGVYTISFKMPAYKEEEEWHNRFIILRQGEDMDNGWNEELCLGTDIFESNQSNFRVENEKETYITVYYHPESGAVVILDSDGNRIDYKFSWVGIEDEVKYFTASEFTTCGFLWPEEHIYIDDIPDIKTKNDILYNYISSGDPKEYSVGNSVYKYKELIGGTIEIIGYEGEDTQITIPDKINGKKVTSIGTRAFCYCRNLINIKIPSTVDTLWYAAFSLCENLKSVEISEGVSSIKT